MPVFRKWGQESPYFSIFLHIFWKNCLFFQNKVLPLHQQDETTTKSLYNEQLHLHNGFFPTSGQRGFHHLLQGPETFQDCYRCWQEDNPDSIPQRDKGRKDVQPCRYVECRNHVVKIINQGRETSPQCQKTMKYDFHYIRKAKNMDTINKILQKFFSRTDLKDVTYEVIEISSGSLKYQLDFNANWK